MALLHMLAQWKHHHPATDIQAATVDHRLRAASAQEAKLAGALANSLGIAHKTLRWKHDGATATAIQERARDARYELLHAHARRIGADVLMTAHHSGDQAETILFRLLRGSGIEGLSGMAVERPLGKIALARPLLDLRKSDLVEWCRLHGLAFAEDPGNSDSRYARARLRTLLPELEKEGLGANVWSRLGRRAARAEAALAGAAVAAHARVRIADDPDIHEIDFSALAQEPEEIALRVLGAAIARFSPHKPLRLDRAENLLERLLVAQKAKKRLTATLGGVCVRLSSEGKLTLQREGERTRGLKSSSKGRPISPKA